MWMAGKHDVAGRLVQQLDDPFAQVGVDDLDAATLQVRVQVALFGEHGLALDDLLRAVILQDLQHDPVVLLSVASPMHVGPLPRGLFLKLLQVIRQASQGVQLDLRGHFAEPLPFRHGLSGFVAFGPHEPQRLVVPTGSFAVGDELRGVIGVIAFGHGRHVSNSNNFKPCGRLVLPHRPGTRRARSPLGRG